MATDAFAAASGARKVLCLDPVSTAGQKELQEGGYTVDSRKAVSNEEMDALLASGDYCSVIVRAANTVRAATFDGAKGSLVVVGRAGVGVDNIDLEAAKRAGVTVVNAPNGNTGAVAELTFGLLIAQARNIIAAHRSIAEGKWDKSALLGHSLQGKTLGIVGMGGIGRGVASRALAFGMKVVTPKRKSGSNAPVDGVQVMASLDDVLAVCDYLTLHVPLSDSTRDMIGRDQLAKMKRTAVLINAARGGVVDETALLEALGGERLGGAALDVFTNEGAPLDPIVQKLALHPRVVCTPHLGAATAEAGDLVMSEVCNAVKAVLDGQDPGECLVQGTLPRALRGVHT